MRCLVACDDEVRLVEVKKVSVKRRFGPYLVLTDFDDEVYRVPFNSIEEVTEKIDELRRVGNISLV